MSPADTWQPAAPNSWSAMVSKEEDWPRELSVEEPLRWKLLIVVIDCSYGPRLHNPPRSIRALKAKLAAALGIEALSRQTGVSGAEAASAQAIVTGIEGPSRQLLEQDDDLCGFWDRVATTPGMVHAPEEARRSSKVSSKAPSGPSSMQTTLQTTQRRSSSRSSYANQGVPAAGSALGAFFGATLSKSKPRESGIDLSAFEQGMRQLEERCEAAEAELDACLQQLETTKAEMEVLEDELEVERRHHLRGEERIAQLEELSAQLQEQNLGFIKTFEEQLENARREIKQEVVDSYQAVLDSQAKRVHEADGQQRRLEGELRVKTEKIRDLEAVVRQERSNAARSDAVLAGEHAKIEELSGKIQSQAARLRHLEWHANSWYRKAQELAEESALRVIQESPNFHSFTIWNFKKKLTRWPKGRMVQSPEFRVDGLGETQIEFFPSGEVNSRPGWCSLRLRIPDGSRLRWRVKVGQREFDVRDDHYDSKQWWNRYGIQCLNFCQVDELLPEALPESDTAQMGIEVLEVLETMQEQPVVVAEAPAPKAPSVRPGTAPQRAEPRRPSTLEVHALRPPSASREAPRAKSQPSLPRAAHAVAATSASSAAAAAAFAVKSGNLPPAVAASRGLLRQRSHTAVRSKGL